jgi:hypothetical protein
MRFAAIPLAKVSLSMLMQVGSAEWRPAGEGAGQTCPGKEREASNVRVLPGMIQLAWRFLMFHKQSALVQRYRKQTSYVRGTTCKALMRGLLVAPWQLAPTGRFRRVSSCVRSGEPTVEPDLASAALR